MCIQQHVGADAVWERDQRLAEKLSSLGRTSRSGDATSVLYTDSIMLYSTIHRQSLNLSLVLRLLWKEKMKMGV